MAVRIRMKKMGRKHRPFFRICAVDGRAPRDGRVIEELGHSELAKEIREQAEARAPLIDPPTETWRLPDW